MSKAFRAFALVMLALLGSAAFAGGRPIPMVEIIDAPVIWPDGQVGDLQTVQKAVLSGLFDKGWVGRVVSPGVVQATLRRDDWTCEIAVTFNTANYSIKYVNSTNLDYDASTHVIHRNFNKWLVLLQQRIDLHMMQAGS